MNDFKIDDKVVLVNDEYIPGSWDNDDMEHVKEHSSYEGRVFRVLDTDRGMIKTNILTGGGFWLHSGRFIPAKPSNEERIKRRMEEVGNGNRRI